MKLLPHGLHRTNYAAKIPKYAVFPGIPIHMHLKVTSNHPGQHRSMHLHKKLAFTGSWPVCFVSPSVSFAAAIWMMNVDQLPRVCSLVASTDYDCMFSMQPSNSSAHAVNSNTCINCCSSGKIFNPVYSEPSIRFMLGWN